MPEPPQMAGHTMAEPVLLRSARPSPGAYAPGCRRNPPVGAGLVPLSIGARLSGSQDRRARPVAAGGAELRVQRFLGTGHRRGVLRVLEAGGHLVGWHVLDVRD